MHSIGKNVTGPEAASDVQPSDKSRLSAAVDCILQQASHGQAAIPPDLTRPAFESSQTNRTPQPLGIPWLDSMLAGGLADGEVFLFLEIGRAHV